MNTIEVRGTPAPKGSTRAILIRGKAVNVPGGSNANRNALRDWDRAVKAAAVRCERVDGPVAVSVTFRLRRPRAHYNASGVKPSAPPAPAVKPDIDKLVRATLDALNGIAWDDDARIVALSVRKAYAANDGDVGATVQWEAA